MAVLVFGARDSSYGKRKESILHTVTYEFVIYTDWCVWFTVRLIYRKTRQMELLSVVDSKSGAALILFKIPVVKIKREIHEYGSIFTRHSQPCKRKPIGLQKICV